MRIAWDRSAPSVRESSLSGKGCHEDVRWNRWLKRHLRLSHNVSLLLPVHTSTLTSIASPTQLSHSRFVERSFLSQAEQEKKNTLFYLLRSPSALTELRKVAWSLRVCPKTHTPLVKCFMFSVRSLWEVCEKMQFTVHRLKTVQK